MPMTRTQAIRTAAALPVGNPTRRKLLAALQHKAEYVGEGQGLANILGKKWRHAVWDEKRGVGEANLGGLEIRWTESGNDPAVIVQITKHPYMKTDAVQMALVLKLLGDVFHKL